MGTSKILRLEDLNCDEVVAEDENTYGISRETFIYETKYLANRYKYSPTCFFDNDDLETKRNFLESMLNLDPEFWIDFCKEKNIEEQISVVHESKDLRLKEAIQKKKN
jgi:hypothetical protein